MLRRLELLLHLIGVKNIDVIKNKLFTFSKYVSRKRRLFWRITFRSR